MTTYFHLTESMFSTREQLLLEADTLEASAFRFESGVAAIRLRNELGERVLLPFQGQQIWSASFRGRNITMRSMFDQPRTTRNYLETYGGFLLHCLAHAFFSCAASSRWRNTVLMRAMLCRTVLMVLVSTSWPCARWKRRLNNSL